MTITDPVLARTADTVATPPGAPADVVTPSSGDADEQRPQRANARRNYETLVVAARETFAEDGVSASLEAIARRAQVGIGTLYRHFPTRQHLFDSVYSHEVERLCHAADDVGELPPWDALAAWLHHYIGFAATKRALTEVLVRDSDFFRSRLAAIYAAGGPLLEQAQQAGLARDDVGIDDVMRLISGVAVIQCPTPDQRERIFQLALDGLRTRGPVSSP